MYEYDQITPIDSTDIWRERAAQCNDISQTEENKLGNRLSVYGVFACACAIISMTGICEFRFVDENSRYRQIGAKARCALLLLFSAGNHPKENKKDPMDLFVLKGNV